MSEKTIICFVGDRKITLIVDNCPAHPLINKVAAIELIILPHNAISKSEYMDQGEKSQTLKYYYGPRWHKKAYGVVVSIFDFQRSGFESRSWR